MFSMLRPLSFSAQLGPYDTFAELQAAAGREIPGSILIPAPSNSTQGRITNASGADLGLWHSPPFTLAYPVSLTAYTGPCETVQDMQTAISKQIPGALLIPPVKGAKDQKSGEVQDAQGNTVGHWYEN
jgi:hypothetical protein